MGAVCGLILNDGMRNKVEAYEHRQNPVAKPHEPTADLMRYYGLSVDSHHNSNCPTANVFHGLL